MMTKKELKNKLTQIHERLVAYSEDVFPEMTEQYLFVVKVKYAVITAAIYDLYHGTTEEQQEAIDYFKSVQYTKDCLFVGVRQDVMNTIVHNPTNYADDIKDVPDEDLIYNEI